VARKPIHEEAGERSSIFIALLLHKLADARGCEVKHLSAADASEIERIALLLFREGYEFAYERPTGETPIPFQAPTRVKGTWE